jgi:hypothetical protein
MKSSIIGRCRGLFIALAGLLVLSIVMPVPMAVQAAGQEGMDIKIRAKNRSIDDAPSYCSSLGGEGFKGDRLDVDVSTASDGSAVGTARFRDADGNVTLIDIDKVFTFFGGLVLQNETDGNTVAIWFGDIEGVGNLAPAHVNVELPRGCVNTVSTFTVGQDKVTVQIKTN